jgi:hypothetical protein
MNILPFTLHITQHPLMQCTCITQNDFHANVVLTQAWVLGCFRIHSHYSLE